MSEDEAKVAGHEEEQDEVEAHRRNKLTANVEPGDEARKEDDDDFEAHRKAGKLV
jgi:hypothetical protein